MISDYLIVGAGIYGATCARELAEQGQRVLVVERDGHVGGQCYTETRDGQIVSLHGGHIFHTNDRRLWEFVNRFAEFKQYSHHVKARAGGAVYSFPPNRMTYQQLGANGHTAEVVRAKFFVGYTEKMWGKPIDEVPASVLARIPMRDTWDDHYFSDAYQGLPVNGYTGLVEALLAHRHIRVELGEDYLARRTYWDDQARRRVIYTGPVDALFGYQLGRLAWRSLRFEHEHLTTEDHQGCPTLNECDRDVPHLRTEEWRHWWKPEPGAVGTWITRTYPEPSGPPLYPVDDEFNRELYARYAALCAGHRPHIRLGGRLGNYRYWDMHQAIAAAQRLVAQELV